MIALTDRQHDLLTRIRDAGSEGYEVRQGELCDVLLMGTHGLTVFTNQRQTPQRVCITPRGRGFINRVAA